ncbi:MAG: hypothetical protein COA65_08965 [Rhodospirillaceae bacterium]|nr:MAG: hypothetical protein COA65_08965 [Rhodospirillaceae bacterium]
MADVIDRAQALEERQRKAALDGVRRRTGTPAQEVDNCTDCLCRIPRARKKAQPGTTRCADCQKDTERQKWGRG